MATKVPPTEDLPGIPPVPPSDMAPAYRAVLRKRLDAVSKSLKAVQDEQAGFPEGNTGIAAVEQRRSYLASRALKFAAEMSQLVNALEGKKVY